MSNAQEIETKLRHLISSKLGAARSRIGADESFDRLGVDSVSAVGLVLDIEKTFGLRLPETLLLDHPTLATLSQYLKTAIEEHNA